MTTYGVLPVTEAAAKIAWLPSREAVARVARHLGCTLEAAALQIVGKGKAGLIRSLGLVEGRQVSPLSDAWNGTVDLLGYTMNPPEGSYEITNLELCFIDLVAAGLLPAPAERARWSAEEAIAYLIKGVPLPWKEWMGVGATASEIEQAEINLGQVISEGVPAWGWHPLEKRRKRIPSDAFRDERIEKKVLPVPGTFPKVVVRIDGNVGTSPPSRIAEYIGPLWRSIEVDAAALKQARPRLSATQAEPVIVDPATASTRRAPSTPAQPIERLPVKRWIEHARKQRRDRLAGLGPQPAAKLLAGWMKEGHYSPEKVVGWKRIKNILTDENKPLDDLSTRKRARKSKGARKAPGKRPRKA